MATDPASYVQRRKTYELVAERLLEDMRDQKAAPGYVLPTERELTERFNVGRSSIREALRMLESQGVIVLQRHGQFVAGSLNTLMRRPVETMLTLERSDLTDVFELRQMIEPALASLAAERASENDLSTMQRSIDDMSGVLPQREPMLEADLAFHRAIAVASGNRLASEVVDALHTSLRTVLRRAYYVSEVALDQHRRIHDAIQNHSPDEARAAMADHMAWIGSILKEETDTSR